MPLERIMHDKRLPECLEDKKKYDADHDALTRLACDFSPIKLLVYGATAIILTASIIALVKTVLVKQ
jgi:hypothetical protein